MKIIFLKLKISVTVSVLFFVFPPIALSAQVKDIADSTALPVVLIKSNGIEASLQSIPAAVNLLEAEELNRSAPTSLTASFNRVPGVFVQAGALNTHRISIRGIGARAQYGTNRVKAYFNEIPLSTADGQTLINDIDLTAVDRSEIIKGPNSSIYGSGLGGVITVFAKKPKFDQASAAVSSDYGSYGLQKNTIKTGYSKNRNTVFATYNHLKQKGYRENSDYDRKSFTFNGNVSAGDKGSLSLLGHFTRLKTFIPSSINKTDFETQPQKAAFTWKNARGYESYDKFIAGLSYQYHFSENFKNTTSLFLNYRDAYEPRPFDILKEKSFSSGARTHFVYRSQFLGKPLKASLGGEYLSEKYSGSNFENLYEDFPGQGSVRGKIIGNHDQNRNYYNAFAQANWQILSKLKMVAGINMNATDYSLTDLYARDSIDESGSYQFRTIWSPRLAAQYQLSSQKNLYINVSKGFSVPTVDETLTPEGRINTSLKPETGWNYELGFKSTWVENFYTEVALYTIQVSDLLVARRVGNDQYVGVNAGKTDHNGVEVLLNYRWKLSPDIDLNPYFSASFNNYKFDEFIDQGNDYSGNELTGVPNNKINVGLDMNMKKGLSFYSNALFVSQIPLNDGNTVYSDGYSLVNLKATYSFSLFKQVQVNLNAGVNNLFNKHYAASILPNAVGFGGKAPRYYYPGNPRNYFGGLGLRWGIR